MSPKDLTDALQAALEQRGFKSAMVSSAHVAELRETIEIQKASGLIDKGVYRQYVANFEQMLTQVVSWARSIIVVAMPQPVLEATFAVNGEPRTVVIPPTYASSIDATAIMTLEEVLVPNGYKIVRASLPLKLLAVRSGLARYGKNNISYVEGMGSFHRLIAFYTDLPVVSDTWRQPQPLDECEGCNACTKKCPTGAIDPDQFQLRAGRCLTLHNEAVGPFPEWINQTWHHCLVGCMKCQHFCPVNKDVRSWTEPFAEFTESETELLLTGVPKDEMPPSLVAKFRDIDLLEEPTNLARNLRSVLDSRQ